MKRGRKSIYDADVHPRLAGGLLKRGKTIAEIAVEMGVAKDTIYQWKTKHKEFADALKSSRELVDMDVERSLYQRAMGYSCTETRRTEMTDHQGRVSVKEETLVKEYPPDSTAMIFWLKNRAPHLWRDKQDVSVAVQDDKAIKAWIDKLGI